MTRLITAPGKLVAAGEYAVLFGHEALSLSVNRRVKLRIKESRTFPTVSGVMACVVEELKTQGIVIPPFEAEIDSSDLQFDRAQSSAKLGLGSSAAVAVALTRGLLEFCHQDVEKTLDYAFAAHHRFTGGLGSGIDVATSYYGGAIKFRTNHQAKTYTVTPCSLVISPLSLVAVYTNSTQSTTSFLKQLANSSSHDRKDFDQAILGISQAAQTILECMTNPQPSPGRWQNLCEAVMEHNRAMLKLGRATKIDIMSPAHTQIAQIASRHNGAAKPSGAGGGDISLCFVEDEQRPHFIKELSANSFSVLDLHFCDAGVQ